MSEQPKIPPTVKRATYRHGDLRHALVQAGYELARDGGPDAVLLREATRRAGVAPNAAYRHFANRQDLVDAVCAAALSDLARAIEGEIARLSPDLPPEAAARGALRAVGLGYLSFALEEPGLFRAAFAFRGPPHRDASPEKAGDSGLNPFQLLSSALDGMVKAGALDPTRRSGAEYLAWSAVHGFSILVLDGPLRGLSIDQIEPLARRLVAMVEDGL